MDFALIQRSMPLLLQGALMTIKVLLLASTLSLTCGLIFGILTSDKLSRSIFSLLLVGILFILRAVPFYVQLLIVYFVFNLELFVASCVSLGLCSSGYVAQVVRGGINAIPHEQWEAAKTLGYSQYATVRYVILPQMLRHILPALTNELDAMVKSTAILSSIGLLELTRMGMNIISQKMQPLEIYFAVALLYVCMSAVINCLTKYLERRFQNVTD